jgi:MerR family transcriptional regulator, redox-sensitive transcriptional activator SoxR
VADLTIGELAARSGVATSALRFWEQQGLIVAERTEGNQRRYARATLRRVALIQAGSAAGVPLRRIGEALATLPHDRTPSKRDWSRLSRVWRNDLDRKITELERLRDDLADCIGCGCLSLRSCRLFNPGDHLAGEGPGARKLLP